MQENMDISTQVRDIVSYCLAEEPGSKGAIEIDGIMHKYIFDKGRVDKSKIKIIDLINMMPKEFHEDGGGGWTFLYLHEDKNGNHWGEHRNMEELVCLGISAGVARISPRYMWRMYPGNMPYVIFNVKGISPIGV